MTLYQTVRRRVGAPLLVLLAAAIIPCPPVGAATIGAIPPLCPFRYLTGLPCPGCGMTRSLVCLAHGHFASATTFHPLGILIFALLLTAAAIRFFRLPVILPEKAVNGIVCATAAALLVVWAARMAHFLPYPP